MKPNDNSSSVLFRFLKISKIFISLDLLFEELQKHPDYGTLLALSDVLNSFDIENSAYKVPIDEISEIPTPFIAHDRYTGEFFIVRKLTDTHAVITDHRSRSRKLNIEELKKLYNGTILLLEEPESAQRSIRDRLVQGKALINYIAILGLTGIFIAFVISASPGNFSWQYISLAIIKTAGLIVSILLLVQSIDQNNTFVRSLCGEGEKNDCNAILTSSAAKIFEGLSWSEVGFFYFAGTWLAFLLESESAGLWQAIAILNLLSLPYTFYSINFQLRSAKQICVFCMAIQVILWLEFIPLFSSLTLTPEIDRAVMFTLGRYLFAPAALWVIVKPYLLNNKELMVVKEHLRKFKFSRKLFEAALKENEQLPIPSSDCSIVLGAKEPSVVITLVSHPFCKHCRKAHEQIEQAMQHLPELQCRIIFAGTNISSDDDQTLFIKHLMAMSILKDNNYVEQALHDWYSSTVRKYNVWGAKYPINIDTDLVNKKLQEQDKWVRMSKITSTPTILVNGYQLPRIYQVNELKYMLSQ